MNVIALPIGIDEDGLRIAVRLTPRAGRSDFGGIGIGAGGKAALIVRVAARPVDGAANKALIAFLAAAAGLPRSAVKIRSGETSRLKIVHLAGDAAAIGARLHAAVDRQHGKAPACQPFSPAGIR